MNTTVSAPAEATATDPWTMAGTEGTNQYKVLATSSFGRVGYRIIPGYGTSQVRIRVEPSDEAHAAKIAEVLTRGAGWKQPGDSEQDRFSTVVVPGEHALHTLAVAFAQIKRGRPLSYNPVLPDYKTDLAAL